jgi:hypothetical protein
MEKAYSENYSPSGVLLLLLGVGLLEFTAESIERNLKTSLRNDFDIPRKKYG